MNKKDIEDNIRKIRKIRKGIVDLGFSNWISDINYGATLGDADRDTKYYIEKQIEKKYRK